MSPCWGDCDHVEPAIASVLMMRGAWWQVPGTARVLPGYPTLRTLGVTAALKMAAVEVLGMPSKKESLILTVKVGCILCT